MLGADAKVARGRERRSVAVLVFILSITKGFVEVINHKTRQKTITNHKARQDKRLSQDNTITPRQPQGGGGGDSHDTIISTQNTKQDRRQPPDRTIHDTTQHDRTRQDKRQRHKTITQERQEPDKTTPEPRQDQNKTRRPHKGRQDSTTQQHTT